MTRTPQALLTLFILSLLASPACVVGDETEPDAPLGANGAQLTIGQKVPRYGLIRDAARARGIGRTGFLLAGIANHESNLVMCHSEAQSSGLQSCPGPRSPSCNGEPIIAGFYDGPCNIQQGGLGMFQFDAGTFTDTLNLYGNNVLTIDGQIEHVFNFVTRIVKLSRYTTNAETDAKARAWIANFDINNGTLRDQWIKTLVHYYNGCESPSWSCWEPRYRGYSEGLRMAIDEPGGLGFWAGGGGTRCGNSPATVGLIDEKYRALGGCGSVLGAPITDEQTTPDGVGRYSVFERGSIYWTPAIGAFEVHGLIRDQWKAVGWETGVLGYPISDETKTPDGIGRFNHFERGSIYWTPQTGAHEVLGTIRETWASLGWETSSLGYPVSGEYDVAGGRKSDFQHGAITWNSSTNQTTVTTN